MGQLFQNFSLLFMSLQCIPALVLLFKEDNQFSYIMIILSLFQENQIK